MKTAAMGGGVGCCLLLGTVLGKHWAICYEQTCGEHARFLGHGIDSNQNSRNWQQNSDTQQQNTKGRFMAPNLVAHRTKFTRLSGDSVNHLANLDSSNCSNFDVVCTFSS
eukprot:5735499-Amphidinium_carterae.1